MTPFWLAEHLGLPLIASVVALRWDGDTMHATQAQGRGRRRVLAAAAPLIATVGRAAPPAPLSATAPALRGTVIHDPAGPTPPDPFREWAARPARVRPRALAAPGAVVASAARRDMIDPDPIAAADAILDLLEREALIVAIPPTAQGSV
jgi:hypothetical protein